MNDPNRLRLEILEDRCLPSFSPVGTLPVGLNPQAVATGDFNNDDQIDVASVNSGDSTVSVLLGNDDGTFQEAISFGTGLLAQYLAVGDFDEDGNLDLATVNHNYTSYYYGGYFHYSTDGDVSIHFGNGDGTFQAPINVDIYGAPTSLAVGDFNGDGYLDLGMTSNVYVPPPPGWGWYYSPSGHNESQVNVLLGNGAGAFSASATIALGYGFHTSAAVADFNGDFKDDFATVNSDYGTVSVLLGATYPLGAPTNFATGWYPRAVTVGDFTGDGILDLATAGQSVDILPGYGDGTFRPVVRQYIDPVAVAAADFNGDGKLDLVTADYGSVVTVLLGAGDGTVQPPLVIATGGAGAVSIAVGDFNRDGRPDVATANSSSNNVSVLLNDGNWPAADAPTITIRDATVTEGNTGTTAITFTVDLSAAYGQPVTVDFATADGSATVAAGDYQENSGTLTIAAGQTTGSITVPVNGDRVVEPTEAFYLRLSNPTNAFITDATAVGNITDDEPRITINNVTVTEGNTGSVAATFQVSLSFAYDAAVTVHYATADASATAGSDYTAASGDVTFAPGETTKTITIAVTGDRDFEWDETFVVNLSSPTNATIADGQGVGTIMDDEPRIRISDVSKKEGNGKTTVFTFTVTLAVAYDQSVTVNYATADGTATVGDNDYVATSGTVTFAPGETKKTITVVVQGDKKKESNESFFVNLSGASSNALIWDAQGIGTILNDDR